MEKLIAEMGGRSCGKTFRNKMILANSLVGKKVRNKADKDMFEVKGYIFNNGEYYFLIGDIKVHIDRVTECYEVVE